MPLCVRASFLQRLRQRFIGSQQGIFRSAGHVDSREVIDFVLRIQLPYLADQVPRIPICVFRLIQVTETFQLAAGVAFGADPFPVVFIEMYSACEYCDATEGLMVFQTVSQRAVPTHMPEMKVSSRR